MLKIPYVDWIRAVKRGGGTATESAQDLHYLRKNPGVRAKINAKWENYYLKGKKDA